MEEGPWYCSCGGQLNTYVAIGSWRLHRDQFIDLLIISFCALLLAVVSNPTSDRLGTPCLRNQRDWVVKWLYLWLLSRAYVCLNGLGLALKSGVWVVAEFSEGYCLAWALQLLLNPCPSERAMSKVADRSLMFSAMMLPVLVAIRQQLADSFTPVPDRGGTCSRTLLGFFILLHALLYLGLGCMGIWYHSQSKDKRLWYSKSVLKDLFHTIMYGNSIETPQEQMSSKGSDRRKDHLLDHSSGAQLVAQTMGEQDCAPGLCTLIVVMANAACWAVQAGVVSFHNSDGQCSTTFCASTVLALCLHIWFIHIKLVLAPLLILTDLVMHNFLWGRLCQDTVLNSFAQNVNWRQYKRDPVSWDELDIIASGAEGAVYQAHLKEDPEDTLVVLKKPHIDGVEALRQTMQEAAMLAHVHNEMQDRDDPGQKYIVALRGFCPTLPEVSLLLEYCTGGDLLHRLRDLRRDEVGSPTRSTLKQRLQWATEVAEGMHTLHHIGVAHRDLKTDNCLLCADDTIRISDFGCARVFDSSVDRFATVNKGTLAFMAPEVMLGSRDSQNREMRVMYDPFASDVFSFGFLLYECVTFNREPLCRSEITDDTEYAYEIANKSPVLCPRDFEGTEVEFEDNLVRVLAGCFESDPQMRPKFDEICDVLRDEAARFKSTTSSSEPLTSSLPTLHSEESFMESAAVPLL